MGNNLFAVAQTAPIAPLSTVDDTTLVEMLQLIRTENVGPITFHDLVRRFGTPKEALDAVPHLATAGGKSRGLSVYPKSSVETEIARARAIGASFVTYQCETYPTLLKTLPDAPPVLTYLGNIELASSDIVGIVGARNASLNAKKLCQNLARDMGERGYIISSGLARGIDTQAHISSLPSGTIAVVAGGIDVIYPPENEGLYREIAQKGLILAESPFSVEPQATFFPKRNRIISGLSLGVIVVEAALKSGSLITAKYALDQNRDVFAVPGSPFDPRCRGTNKLIQDGAHLVQSSEDVLSVLQSINQKLRFSSCNDKNIAYLSDIRETPTPKQAEIAREMLLEHLSYSPISIDELIRQCNIHPSIMLYVLLELELAGRVMRSSGHLVSLVGSV